MSATRSAAGSIPADSRISVSGAVSAAHRARRSQVDSTPAEAGGGHDQPGGGHHRVGVGRRPRDLEREQRPEAAGHLQRRHRRRGQPRVVHRRHPRLGGQELRDREGVVRLPRDPQRQRLHPAQDQPALERTGDRAARRPPPPDRRGQLRVPGHDRAAEHVRVPGDRLGERVHRGHRAEVERLLQQPGRGRVVDHERRVGRRRERPQRRQVRHPQQRVGRRLRPQHGRPGPQRDLDHVQVELVHRHRHRPVRPQFIRQGPRVVVAVVREHDPRPPGRQRQHQRHRRRLPGRERHRLRARPLGRGQGLLDRRPPGVAHPPVPALRIRLPLRHVGAGGKQRRRQRRPRPALGPRMHQPRLKIKFHKPILPNGPVTPPPTPIPPPIRPTPNPTPRPPPPTRPNAPPSPRPHPDRRPRHPPVAPSLPRCMRPCRYASDQSDLRSLAIAARRTLSPTQRRCDAVAGVTGPLRPGHRG